MDLLADRFTVVAIDLLGHGVPRARRSRRVHPRRALDDIDEVLAELLGRHRHPAVLVGHSLGGYLALAYAATRPGITRGVVVLNTGPGYRDPVKREEWNERSKRNAHRFGVPEQVTTLNLQEDSVVMDRLADMATPTLVLAGSDDRPEYTGAGEYLERKMPDARLVVVDGGGHSMHEDTHAGEVADLIAAFVDGLAASRASPVRVVQRSESSPGPRDREQDRHLAGAADLAAGPGDRAAGSRRNSGMLRQPLLDGDAQLHPGQVRAGAAVDAGAERDVPVVLAVEDHLVGVGERLGVAVGGGEVEQHLVARHASGSRANSTSST